MIDQFLAAYDLRPCCRTNCSK